MRYLNKPLRAYASLTRTGQVKRLRVLAKRALAHSGLGEAELSLLQHVENTTFSVWLKGDVAAAPPRGRYLLRVHGYQSAAAVTSECHWLLHLHENADLSVPTPVALTDDRFCTEVSVPGLPRPRACSLLRWVPGRSREHWTPKPRHFEKLGRLTARLHSAARFWRRPTDFVRPRWDWHGLFGDEGAFGSIGSVGWNNVPTHHRALFRASADAIAQVMDDIGETPEAFGLIHADLHFGNVVFSAGDMHAIDFDDCGPGYWVYDIATAMRPWRFDTNWDAYWTAFHVGYTSIAPLPPGTDRLDLFIVARHLATTLWAASRAFTNAELARSLDARCTVSAAVIDRLAAA